MSIERDRICALVGGGDQFTVNKRGSKILVRMDEGVFGVDYGNIDNPVITMHNPRNNTHATVTSKELEEMRNRMMGGGGQQGRPNMGGIMDQIRQRAGAKELKAEGPKRSSLDCEEGERWMANMGEIGFDGNPMQEKWWLEICVSDGYPELAEAYAAFSKTSMFDMGEDDAIDQMEDKIVRRGKFPIERRELKQGGGLTGASLEFELQWNRMEEGPVSPEEVNAAIGTKVDFMTFMGSMAGGMR